MIVYYLDVEAYDYLTEWSDQFRLQAQYCPEFDKKAQVILRGYDGIRFFTERKRNSYKFNMLDKDGLLIKGEILLNHDDEEHQFQLRFVPRKGLSDTEEFDGCIHAMQVFCTTFIVCNCFMWYGNIVDNREYAAVGRNESGKKKIITFRKYKESVYAIPVGNHRSPEGVFSVRGHFRHYKNGKIVWIDSYLKGTD